MARQHIYTVMSGTPSYWVVVKMERDFEHVESYEVSKLVSVCTCFAGSKSTCRHRELVAIFQMENKVDSREAFDYDKKRWVQRPKAAMEMID